MTVLLPILVLLGVAHAHPGWRPTAAGVIADPVSVEVALDKVGLSPRSASVLAGEERWVRSRGTHFSQETGLTWSRLVGAEVVEPGTARGRAGRLHCTHIEGHDPVPGDRAVVLFPGRPHRTEAAVAEAGPPALILASEEGREFAFAHLLPGDVVQVVEGERRGERTERIEYRRGTQVLTLERTGKEIEACYSLDAPE